VDTDPGSTLRGRARFVFQSFVAISASNSPARPSAKSLISGALFLKFAMTPLPPSPTWWDEISLK
jgi:hypothetical protein